MIKAYQSYIHKYKKIKSMKQAYDLINPVTAVVKELPPIIFLHGLADCRRTWKKTAPVIARKTGRKAYLLDARNHGESSRSDKMDYDVLTRDVLDLMTEHSIEKAVIIGHSMGGRTAINLALKHPDRVDILIVEDMTPRNIPSANSSLIQMLAEFADSILKSYPPDMDLNSVKRSLLEDIMSLVSDRFISAEIIERIWKLYDLDMMPIKKVGVSFQPECNSDAILTMLENDPLVQDLPKKNLKFYGDTLFVYGSKGFYNLDSDSTVKKLFPNAAMKKIEGASHFAHLDYPDEFVDIVSNFILQRNFNTTSQVISSRY